MNKTTVKLIAVARNRLAASLRKARANAGLTQATVAERAGMHPRSYQKIEAGSVSTTIDRIAKLSSALGIDPVELFEEKRRS